MDDKKHDSHDKHHESQEHKTHDKTHELGKTGVHIKTGAHILHHHKKKKIPIIPAAFGGILVIILIAMVVMYFKPVSIEQAETKLPKIELILINAPECVDCLSAEN